MLRIYEVAGILFALEQTTYKIGFPGWPEPILDSVTGFGASIEKKGACTSPLFHFVLLPCDSSLGHNVFGRDSSASAARPNPGMSAQSFVLGGFARRPVYDGWRDKLPVLFFSLAARFNCGV
jgi:hypothetical protein